MIKNKTINFDKKNNVISELIFKVIILHIQPL